MSNIVGRLLNPKLERGFLRLIVAILLIVFLASQLPLGEKALGRLLNFPDLRHLVSVKKLETNGGSDLDAASLTVVNLGFGAAENVLVHVKSHQGHIASYGVDSQELYQIINTDLDSGVLEFWLDRFASGASIRIELVGTDFLTDTIMLSAASDQGASLPLDSPAFSDQVDSYTAEVTGLFRQAREIINETQSIREVEAWSSTKPTVAQILHIVSSNEFQTVGLAALVLILLIVIFLPDGCLAHSVSFIIGFVVWLFFSFQIPTWLAIALAVALFVILGAIIAIGTRASEGCFVVLGIMLALMLVIGGIAVWWYWFTSVSAKWILGAATSLATFIVIALAGGFQPESTR